MDILKDEYLLPYDDDYFEGVISIFKDTMIIKDISPFKFLYFSCCKFCIDKYIRLKQSNVLKYIHLRETKKLKYNFNVM
tara:strand:- start:763 stop:999 length:237 start_codon:yes stop_codon:yes gene_type:complete